jgi:alkylhydroperoxidase family enzyme
VGLSEDQLAAIAAGDAPRDVYSPVERAVVDYARRLTRSEPIDDELFDQLRQHFSLHELMELCFTVGIASVVNGFHATFHTPLDERTRDAVSTGSPLPIPGTPE